MNKFEKVEKRVNKTEVILPKRQTFNSAGYDFYMPFDIEIQPQKQTELYFTDIKVRMDNNIVLMLYPRSSLGIKGISIANTVGIIDADYYNNPNNEGNIGFVLKNNSNEIIKINKNERFMQGIFMRFIKTDDDDVTTERTGGHGSTN